MLSTDTQIGNIIRQKRLELGLTQTELGQKMGVGKTAVAKWESGKVKNLKREALPLLAGILQISPLALIGISDNNSKDICVKSTEFSLDAFTRIEKLVANEKKNQECILITKEDVTPAQFEQIKQFIDFIKASNKGE